MGLEPPRPTLKVDAQMELHELDRAFNRHLETLRPFGPGNPAPVIVCLGVQCVGSRVINQRHLKVQLAQGGGSVLEAIAFDMAAHHPRTAPWTWPWVPGYRITRDGPPWTSACWIGAAPEKVTPLPFPFIRVRVLGFGGEK